MTHTGSGRVITGHATPTTGYSETRLDVEQRLYDQVPKPPAGYNRRYLRFEIEHQWLVSSLEYSYEDGPIGVAPIPPRAR